MGVKQESKRDLARKMHERYLRASRVERGKMLDEFVELTGYHRTYAHTLLKHGPSVRPKSIRRAGRPATYGPRVIAGLKVVAEALSMAVWQAPGSGARRRSACAGGGG